MPQPQRTITDVVRDIMAALPDVEEFLSHGSPTFRVPGRKVFATYTINHHGDGRVALNLMAPPGAQAAFVKMRPRVYFVPPYVGPSGWLGIELDQGLAWSTVIEHVREAYEMTAPAALVQSIPKNIRVAPPTRKFRPEEVDPFQAKAAQALLKKLDAILLQLPETNRGTQFGSPTWRAGTKTFVTAHYYTGRLKLSFWVGPTRQRELKKDQRFEISQYTGHNGWIDLAVEREQDWPEITALALASYRHFALKRMLKML
jgi:predicted DNA-binding protein (MmcQ/YjbR family)